jgi:hypothetical protein
MRHTSTRQWAASCGMSHSCRESRAARTRLATGLGRGSWSTAAQRHVLDVAALNGSVPGPARKFTPEGDQPRRDTWSRFRVPRYSRGTPGRYPTYGLHHSAAIRRFIWRKFLDPAVASWRPDSPEGGSYYERVRLVRGWLRGRGVVAARFPSREGVEVQILASAPCAEAGASSRRDLLADTGRRWGSRPHDRTCRVFPPPRQRAVLNRSEGHLRQAPPYQHGLLDTPLGQPAVAVRLGGAREVQPSH